MSAIRRMQRRLAKKNVRLGPSGTLVLTDSRTTGKIGKEYKYSDVFRVRQQRIVDDDGSFIGKDIFRFNILKETSPTRPLSEWFGTFTDSENKETIEIRIGDVDQDENWYFVSCTSYNF